MTILEVQKLIRSRFSMAEAVEIEKTAVEIEKTLEDLEESIKAIKKSMEV